jgi:hypothetical protein
MHATRCALAVVFATTLLAGLIAPSAVADGAVPLGGSAGIGHDKTGELVGFTAGHCGGPGAPVVGEGAENHGPVGTVVAVGDGLDYGVIKFDPAKVVPTASFAGFPINGIGPDPTNFGQPLCTQGGATGNGCGTFKFGGPRPGIVAAHMQPWQPGDDGAPVTADGQLVGMTRDGYTGLVGVGVPVLSTHITFTLFSVILGDVNAKGAAGAGFSPISG